MEVQDIAAIDVPAAEPIVGSSRTALLSSREEADLRMYFAFDPAPVPYSRSCFGPMLERASRQNHESDELPTPLRIEKGVATGAPWTEILACNDSHVLAGDAELPFIAYIDSRAAIRRVHRRIERVPDATKETLRLYYGTPEAPPASEVHLTLATLTDALQIENRRRAANDRHEALGETVQRLVRASRDARLAREQREAARTTLRAVRREAAALLLNAQRAYAVARREERRCQ